MNTPIVYSLLIFILSTFSLSISSQDIGQLDIVKRSVIFNEGERRTIEEGLLWVPEVYGEPKSRSIPVHFLRVRSGSPTQAPVFFLPGGPGGTHNAITIKSEGDAKYSNFGAVQSAWGKQYIDLVTPHADLIFVNQRGNIGLSMASALSFYLPSTQNLSKKERTDVYLTAAVKAQSELSEMGIQVEGYDFISLINDLESLRKQLGYKKIRLMGGSFGSQWALGYMSLFAQHVDQAILDGIEPINFAYDNPTHLDKALKRFLSYASTFVPLNNNAPQGGYLNALKTLKHKLDSSPVLVELPSGNITINGNDLSEAIYKLRAGNGTLHERLHALPQFIKRVLDGDYKYLAEITQRSRNAAEEALIFILVDSSIGISPEREANINKHIAASFSGNVNALYQASKGMLATQAISQEMLKFKTIDIPTLLVQGDMDFSTPMENALAQLEYLPNGHAVIVKGATHNVFNEIYGQSDAFKALISDFLNDKASFASKTTELRLTDLNH